MREETVKVYSFEELDEDAQEKAIEEARYHNVDYEWWDFLHDEFSSELAEIGVDAGTFYWNLDRGDYFYAPNASISDERLLLKAAGIDLRSKEARRYTVDGAHLSIETRHFGGGSARNYVETYSDDPEIEEKIQDLLDNKFEDFKSRLRDEQEYLTSDEAVRENLIANEYDYTEDGSRY